MKTQNTSRNAETLRSLLLRLNQAGLFPFGFTTQFAEETGLPLNPIRAALKGRPADIEVQEAVVKWAEQKLGIEPSQPKPLDYAHLTIPELVQQRLLPNGYLQQTAELAGTDQTAIGWFVKNQMDGAKRYSTTEPIEKALYQLAGYNKELELIHRVERVLELFRLQEQKPLKSD